MSKYFYTIKRSLYTFEKYFYSPMMSELIILWVERIGSFSTWHITAHTLDFRHKLWWDDGKKSNRIRTFHFSFVSQISLNPFCFSSYLNINIQEIFFCSFSALSQLCINNYRWLHISKTELRTHATKTEHWFFPLLVSLLIARELMFFRCSPFEYPQQTKLQ